MLLKQVMTIMEMIDDSAVSGEDVKALFAPFTGVTVTTTKVEGAKGATDFVQMTIPGSSGKRAGGTAPTLGLIGRLGGIGARPSRIGMVSDGDGAVAALSTAYKLALMQTKGDTLPGDVIVSTHICPDAPTLPHEPVDFMNSPVEMAVMNEYEIHAEMDSILSIDTTKGNNVINHKGISLSPTVKEGYILKVSADLVRIDEMVTGQLTNVFPITTQDITPYSNGVYHINSILQPATATAVPVVGVAITAVSAVPGCATGASHETDIADAASFAVEVAKAYTQGQISFYDRDEFAELQRRYGDMTRLQTNGNA
ncbi:DUF1177 domain-containing protein [Lacticaseibacillus sp. GG6-2]